MKSLVALTLLALSPPAYALDCAVGPGGPEILEHVQGAILAVAPRLEATRKHTDPVSLTPLAQAGQAKPEVVPNMWTYPSNGQATVFALSDGRQPLCLAPGPLANMQDPRLNAWMTALELHPMPTEDPLLKPRRAKGWQSETVAVIRFTPAGEETQTQVYARSNGTWSLLAHAALPGSAVLAPTP